MAEKTFHSITLPGRGESITARVPLTAAEFSPSVDYEVKDYCTYRGKLYRCTTAHAAGLGWKAAHFTPTDVDAEFDRKLDIPVSQAGEPENPREGDLWIDSDENSPIYNVDTSPTLGSTNAVQSGGTKVALNSLDSRKMEHGVITGDFSSSVDYRVGDLVFHTVTDNGITRRTLYRCITDHDSTAWNSAHFTATTLEVELQKIRDSEADTDMIGDLFGAKSTYAVGDYCIYNDNLYKCIQAVNNTGIVTPAFDPDDWEQVKLANEVNNLINSVTEPSYNLWNKESVYTFTKYLIIEDMNLPVGTYTVSALCTSDDPNYNVCRILFRNDTTVLGYLYIKRNNREGYTITLESNCNNVILYASQTANDSTGHIATWKDIQIVAGTLNKPYTSNITAIDIIARGEALNVKNFGAIGDGVTNDTEAFKAMFAQDSFEYYIPAGNYIVEPFICGTNKTNGKLITHNIKIHGDGPSLTRLTLKDESIPSEGPLSTDGCMMFLFDGPTNKIVSIEIADLFIDMNRRNNNYDSTFTPEEFDPWYLQHCHAICIRSKKFASINAKVTNVEFYDLIADGVLFNSNSSDNSFDDIIVDKVVSKGRNAKRSDVCITGDFNSAIISNCSLDDFEIEVNYFSENNLHYFVMNNCNIKHKIDLTSKWNPSLSSATLKNSSKYIINNCNIFGKINFSSLHAIFSACHISASESIYTQNSDVQFINCEIDDNMTLTDDWNSPGLIYNIEVEKGTKLKFFGCDISCNHYRNFVCLNNELNDNNVNINDLIIENNNFKINLISDSTYGGNCFRIGNMNIYAIGNKINLTGQSNASFILIGYQYKSSKAIVIKNNILLNGCVLLKTMQNMIQDGKIITVKAKGNVIYNKSYINTYRWIFDEIRPSRNGIGTAYEIQEIDDYELDNIPSTGMWIVGQKIYNTNPSNNIIGWICTKSGYAVPNTTPSAEFTPISFNI